MKAERLAAAQVKAMRLQARARSCGPSVWVWQTGGRQLFGSQRAETKAATEALEARGHRAALATSEHLGFRRV